jgi:hypothetical protein
MAASVRLHCLHQPRRTWELPEEALVTGITSGWDEWDHVGPGRRGARSGDWRRARRERQAADACDLDQAWDLCRRAGSKSSNERNRHERKLIVDGQKCITITSTSRIISLFYYIIIIITQMLKSARRLVGSSEPPLRGCPIVLITRASCIPSRQSSSLTYRHCLSTIRSPFSSYSSPPCCRAASVAPGRHQPRLAPPCAGAALSPPPPPNPQHSLLSRRTRAP